MTALQLKTGQSNYRKPSEMSSFQRASYGLGDCPKLVAINVMDILCNKRLFFFALKHFKLKRNHYIYAMNLLSN